jgi:hypothetical protein
VSKGALAAFPCVYLWVLVLLGANLAFIFEKPQGSLFFVKNIPF